MTVPGGTAIWLTVGGYCWRSNFDYILIEETFSLSIDLGILCKDMSILCMTISAHSFLLVLSRALHIPS